VTPTVTINFGARFDAHYSYSASENQLSPRITGLATQRLLIAHAGYARYFREPWPVNTNGVLATIGTTAGPRSSPTIVAGRALELFDAGFQVEPLPGLTVASMLLQAVAEPARRGASSARRSSSPRSTTPTPTSRAGS